MDALVYNYSRSDISYMEEAEALRAAYLLAMRLSALGTAGYVLQEARTVPKISRPEEKAAFLERYPWLVGVSREEMKETARVYLLSFRPGRGTKEDIMDRRKLQRIFEGLFEDSRKDLLKMYRYHRLAPLTELVENGLFGYLPADSRDPEKENSDMNPVSAMLHLGLDESYHDAPWLHVLGDGFFRTAVAQRLPVLEAGGAPPAGGSFITRVLSLSLLNELEPEDLRLARQQLRTEREALANAATAWIKGFFGAGTPAEKHDPFPSSVLPAFAALQAAIDRHPLLRPSGPALEVYAGVLPVGALWQQYDERKAIHPDTRAVLDECVDTAARLHPVMAVRRSPLAPGYVQQLSDEEARTGRLRSLSID